MIICLSFPLPACLSRRLSLADRGEIMEAEKEEETVEAKEKGAQYLRSKKKKLIAWRGGTINEN